MRRESSTVVVLVGDVGDGLLAGLSRSPGVSVARAPAAPTGRPRAGRCPAAERLRLAEVDPCLVEEAMRPGHLLAARIRLTGTPGGPALSWSAGPAD